MWCGGFPGIQARGFTSNARDSSPGGDDCGTPVPSPLMQSLQFSQGAAVQSGWPTDSSQATTPDVIPDSPPVEGHCSSEGRTPPGQDGPNIPTWEPRALMQGSKPEDGPDVDGINNAHGSHMGLKLKEPGDLPWDPGKQAHVQGSAAGVGKQPCFKDASFDIMVGATPTASLEAAAGDLCEGRGELGVSHCHPPSAAGVLQGFHGVHWGCPADSAPAGFGVGDAMFDDASSPLPGPSHLRRSSSAAALQCSEEEHRRKRQKTGLVAKLTTVSERQSLRESLAHLHGGGRKVMEVPRRASGIEGSVLSSKRTQSELGFVVPLQEAGSGPLDERRSPCWAAGGGGLVLELGSACEGICQANCLGESAGHNQVGVVIPNLSSNQTRHPQGILPQVGVNTPDCDLNGAAGLMACAAHAAMSKKGTLEARMAALGCGQETGATGGCRVPKTLGAGNGAIQITSKNSSGGVVVALPHKPRLGAGTDTHVPGDEYGERENENPFTPGPTTGGYGPIVHTKQQGSSSGEISHRKVQLVPLAPCPPTLKHVMCTTYL